MADKSFLAWPFFEERHRAFRAELKEWCAANLPVDHHDVDAACRDLVARLATPVSDAQRARPGTGGAPDVHHLSRAQTPSRRWPADFFACRGWRWRARPVRHGGAAGMAYEDACGHRDRGFRADRARIGLRRREYRDASRP
jgi:hypothetical protein